MKTKKTKKKIAISYIVILIFMLTSVSIFGQMNGTCGFISSAAAKSSSSPPSQPTTCAQFLKDFIPQTTDSVLEVRVKMYVFTPSVGVGPWNSATTARAKNALRIVDSMYANCSVNSLSISSGFVPHIPNVRLKFVLVGNLNIIQDHSTYTYTPSAELNPAYNDPTVLNVYYGPAHPNGSGWWAQSSVAYPLPNNHVYLEHGIPGSSSQYDLGEEGWGWTLAHEFGHALGLDHSTYENTVVYDGSSYISPTVGCCAESAADDYVLETSPFWAPCGTPGGSNNLMQETSGCLSYLSPQQMAIMHYHLRTTFKDLLTTKSYNDATTVNHGSDYNVTSNETWTSDRYFKGDIRVKTNKTLIIKCTVLMSKNARIIVEQGGQLIVDGGTITDIWGHLWSGINVMGNPFQPQLTPNPNNSGAVLYQGIVRLKNGATISQAAFGVRNYLNSTGNSGGVIFAQNTNFINNKTDVQMSGQYMYNFTPVASSSWFYYCNFKTTGVIGSGTTPTDHVYLLNVFGVKFRACTFKCEVSGVWPGNGIRSVDGAYTVDKDLTTPCTFQNLIKGVYADNINPLKTPSIKNSVFIDNFNSAYFKNVNYLDFESNAISTAISAQEGVYLNNCKYYKIRNNDFSHSTSYAPGSVGVAAFKSTTGAHEIYRNSFSNLYLAVNCMDINNNPSSLTDGLKINCNDFHVTPNAYDVALTWSTGLALPTVNRTQGKVTFNPQPKELVRNIYGATCGNQNKWQIYSTSNVTINHGSNTNSLTAVTQPTATGCKSGYLNVVDQGIPLDYAADCPANPLSTGGSSTLSPNRLSTMNGYIGDLRGQRVIDVSNGLTPDDFELQSTVGSKMNLFLTDSLEGNLDSVIVTLENNQGFMEDADIQTVFAHIQQGQISIAQDKITDLDVSRADWKAILSEIISFQLDTVNGIDSITVDYSDFFETYAASSDMDGKSIAETILMAARVSEYTEPHAIPEGEVSSSRLMNETGQAEIAKTEDKFNIAVYPNPTKSGINVSYFSKDESDVKIELKDLLGRVIFTKFTSSNLIKEYISLEQLRNGMYLLSLTKDKELIYSKKIIKED